ncbi:hypothetical protein [Streptomyces olivochromogenes]|uniref:hypothetical protein n=1 Tax=Streptomyces olivochromogenes TaxID=1963 RepID=UPI001F45F158|nr:hypothetical protein [Streptomyces olivochromogenes]MCF3137554.1 hypothetical protein [Streptomyces olivochromogenes]
MTPVPPVPRLATALPAVTLVMDPYDDAVHTHAALAAHHPPSGRITLHPGPGTTSETALAHDLLAALGKPPLLPGRFPAGRQPVWEAATAWITALPVTHLTVLRAHRLTARRTERLLQLRALTGIRLTLVCHRPHLPAALHHALQTVDHTVTTGCATARRHYYGSPAAVCLAAMDTDWPAGESGTGVLRRRWISLPALTTLMSFEDSPACRCAAPPASGRGFTPPAMPSLTEREVARRLHTGTAHPHLAAELATACFTAASTSQLSTARVQDAALDGSTVTLHDRHNVRQGCMTHSVPTWARPLLRAAAFSHLLATGTSSGKLFTDPYEGAGLPRLTDFAEQLKLRPPQPPRPKRRKNTRRRPPPLTVWPLCNAHHHLPWTMPEDMQGCPQPPGYKPKRAPYALR